MYLNHFDFKSLSEHVLRFTQWQPWKLFLISFFKISILIPIFRLLLTKAPLESGLLGPAQLWMSCRESEVPRAVTYAGLLWSGARGACTSYGCRPEQNQSKSGFLPRHWAGRSALGNLFNTLIPWPELHLEWRFAI